MDPQIIPLMRLPPGLLSTSFLANEEDILMSVCPTGRVIAYVSQSKGHFIASDGDVKDGSYQNTFQGILDVIRGPTQPRPLATALLVIPIAVLLSGSGKTQVSSVILVGFNDGSLYGYSKSGRRVFVQNLHNDKVLKLTAMTQWPYSKARQPSIATSDLVVLIRDNVACIIEGTSIARTVESNIMRINQGDGFEQGDSTHTLVYKKFNLEQQTFTSDVALIGHYHQSSFDYLRELCLVEGPDPFVRYNPISEAKLIVVGEQPMVSYYKVTKDAGTINVSEVVHEVASRMTNAVLGKLSQATGWFGWGGAKSSPPAPQPSTQPEEKQQRLLNLKMSTNIPDMRRQIESIIVSPIGNLAVMIDSFGRVMLLDVVDFVIRRIWKGYRGAQCGWVVVSDPAQPSRVVQCLCIYLPRGLLEFWPVEQGERVAVFSVGKNHRLLSIGRAIFGEDNLIKKLMGKETNNFFDQTLLLSPDGNLLTFKIPFPSLLKYKLNRLNLSIRTLLLSGRTEGVRIREVPLYGDNWCEPIIINRRDSPISHDTHMIQTLKEKISEGNSNIVSLFNETTAKLKLSQFLIEVVKLAISHYSNDKVSTDLMAILDIAISRSYSTQSCTVPEQLSKYLIYLKHLASFYYELCQLECNHGNKQSPPTNLDSLPVLLANLCGMKLEQSQKIGHLLMSYDELCSLPSASDPSFSDQLSLVDFINSFDVSEVAISCLLPDPKEPKIKDVNITTSPMAIKRNIPECTVVNLGVLVVTPLLLMNEIDYRNTFKTLFIDNQISVEAIICLICKLAVSGSLSLVKPLSTLNSLNSLINHLINLLPPTAHKPLCKQISVILCDTSQVGHAWIMALIIQHLMRQDDDVDMDGWEDVTKETQEWTELCDHLEILTLLSLVVDDVKSLKKFPPIIHVICNEDDSIDEFALDVSKLKFKMNFEDEKQSVCVASLRRYGSSLLGHCIARSFVARKIPGKVLTDSNKTAAVNKRTLTALQWLQLLKDILPSSLNADNLLVYCTFNSAYQWSLDTKKEGNSKHLMLALDYITKLSSRHLVGGICRFLWHTFLGKEIFLLLESMKKRCVDRTPDLAELLFVCRSLLHCVEQAASAQPVLSGLISDDQNINDNVHLNCPLHWRFLPDIVASFPRLDPTVSSLAIQVLLQAEIMLESNAPVSIFTYYKPVVRSYFEKGIFLVSSNGNDVQVSKAVVNKRLKFLNGAVTVYFYQPPDLAHLPSVVSLQSLSASNECCCQANAFSAVVFSLAKLWDLNVHEVKCYWIGNLVAAGFTDRGIEIFQTIRDKAAIARIMVSVLGQLCMYLLDGVHKSKAPHVLSQISPNIMEWMRKQYSSNVLIQIKPVSKDLLVFIESIRPHTDQSTILDELSKLLKLLQK